MDKLENLLLKIFEFIFYVVAFAFIGLAYLISLPFGFLYTKLINYER